jgi:hypothetical protein
MTFEKVEPRPDITHGKRPQEQERGMRSRI